MKRNLYNVKPVYLQKLKEYAEKKSIQGKIKPVDERK